MKVIGKNVLIEIVDFDQLDSKLFVAGGEKKYTGIVQDMGSEVPANELTIGNKVRYKKHGDGEEFEENGKNYVVISIYGILIVYND